MKKLITIALTLIICICFIGCSKSETELSSTGSTDDSINSTIENKNFIDVTSQVEPAEPLTEDQVKQIFEPLLITGTEVYESIDNDLGKFEYENEVSFSTDDGSEYSLITDKGFQKIDDVWEYAYSAYTKEAAQRLFFDNLDQSSTNPRFMEKDGKFYYNRSSRGHVVDFPIETMEIIHQYESMIIIKIDVCYYDDEPENGVFVICKTEDGWKLANSEIEAVNELSTQFLAQ